MDHFSHLQVSLYIKVEMRFYVKWTIEGGNFGLWLPLLRILIMPCICFSWGYFHTLQDLLMHLILNTEAALEANIRCTGFWYV
jgi:hypothetical protein